MCVGVMLPIFVPLYLSFFCQIPVVVGRVALVFWFIENIIKKILAADGATN